MVIFRFFYSVYAILVFNLLMVLLGPLILVPSFFPPGGTRVSFFVIRKWAVIWSYLAGIRYEVKGIEHIDADQPYIYTFNHRSFLDAPVIPMSIPQEVRALGKKELRRIPLFGWIISQFAVWVDRKNPDSREKSIQKLIRFLTKGHSIVVAPEGTRNDSADPLLPFYNGAFRLSIETQTPLLPMAIIGSEKVMPKGSLLMWPGTVQVYFSAPIYPPKELTPHSIETLKAKCYNRLEAMILTHE
ncbi:1-acyl-sn-glycerol-3-phosphate acyltransferase [Lunatimonas lonarensis]|uniref:1-acyl-sn-glycerol-3-phosphate acyltransferase n=1 Tax=Lunatimonas lonarensis TaxID=1232681 RepID=R7ZYB1_9BACT|nr:lysophospholipid acyltransferase family protein [Lunatimonas lonarensis]EON79048.1 1-acyl-sn-glycerol-3-phosphate acyltransferase [Lunatimonas lonarensis]